MLALRLARQGIKEAIYDIRKYSNIHRIYRSPSWLGPRETLTSPGYR